LKRMPTTPVGGIEGGYVEVSGTVERAHEHTSLDPIQDRPCCWFGVETLRTESRYKVWMPVKRAASSRSFVLRDSTGNCLVDLRGARVKLEDPVIIPVREGVVHRVWRIEEGDTITVVGEATQRDGRWCISRPFLQNFIAVQGKPVEAERLLRVEVAANRSPMIVWLVIAAVTLGLIALLSGCERSPEPEEVRVAERHAEANQIEAATATLDYQLEDTGRAERWREELRQWAEQKRALRAVPAMDAEAAGFVETSEAKLVRVEDSYKHFITGVANLRKRGAIGLDGDIPGWLTVTSYGVSIDIRNQSDETIVVNAWRTFVDRPGVYLCEMIAHNARSSWIKKPELAPGQKLNYRNGTGGLCITGTDQNLLAFEIRRDDELLWVTRSRLPDLLGVRAEKIDALLDEAAAWR
jgi:hypothetical protein